MSASTHRVEPLRWRAGALELLDQRALPLRQVYVRCRSAAEVADAIRTMVVRGAPAIGCAAAYGIALEARHVAAGELAARLERASAHLSASRPTAVNLFWALARMRAVWGLAAPDADEMPERLLREAHRIAAEDRTANETMGRLGAALLRDGSCVLTHCNAGALATAGHGTALGVIRSAVAAGKRIRVIANETRPLLQGARLTAWELIHDGIPTTLIADSAAGHLMSQGEIDAVIVGADRVAANGDVANKIGTYTLAVLAHRHQIPFYVACPISTLDPEIASGGNIPIEQRGGAEIVGYGDVRWAADGVAARNPAFDITPAGLVSALITERGIIHRPDVTGIAALLAPPNA